MMPCTVGKCCFCASLRTGAISVACIWLLLDCLFLAAISFATYLLHQSTEGSTWIVYGPFWMSMVFDILYSVAILLDIMLLVGVITVRRTLLNCWLVGYAVLYIIFLLVSGITMPAIGIFFIPVVLVHAGLMVYFWIVVRSYYLELGQQESEGTPIPMAGKVFNTVPTVDVPPAQDTYCEAGGSAMLPTAPPPYTSSPEHAPCYCHNETTSKHQVLIAGSSGLSPRQSSASLDRWV